MENIDLLKQKLEVKTSEELLDIIKQPEQQCIFINVMQSDLKRGCDEIEYYCKSLKNIEGTEGLISDIESSLYSNMESKVDELQNLRTAIEDIREWGQNWKDLAKLLLNKIVKKDELIHFISNDCQIKYELLNNEN